MESYDRLSLEYVVVDVTVDGEPVTDPIYMAIKPEGNRPVIGDFLLVNTVEEISAMLLTKMSTEAPDPGSDAEIELGGAGVYDVWVRVISDPELPVLQAGSITVN